MLQGVTGWPGVVPVDPLLRVRCASDVMSRRVAFTAKDVDEPRSNSMHANYVASFGPSDDPNGLERRLQFETTEYEVDAYAVDVWTLRNCGPPPPLCGYGETAFA